MWTSLLFLWSIPLVIGVVMLRRVAEGNPAVTDEESRLLFGDDDAAEEISLSPLLVFQFALFAVLYFGVGVLQGLVFVNLGTFWSAAIPLMTSIAAVLLVTHWVRCGAGAKRHHAPHSHLFRRNIASLFSR